MKITYALGSMATVVVAVVGLFGATAATADGVAGASQDIAHSWGTDGRVEAILPVGGQVIIAGTFSQVSDPDGHTYPAARVAKYNPATGTFDTSWTLGANGEVTSLAVSGDTLYLGGAFSQVNGVSHHSLAAASLSTGALLPGFTVGTDFQVDSLAIDAGHLYAGGPFTTITDATGPHAAPYLARLGLADGALDTSWVVTPNARVRTLLMTADQTKMYVGGDFTTVGGHGYAARITEVSTSDGSIDPVFRSGNTNQGSKSPAWGMDTDGTNLLVGVAGSGGACALLDATTGDVRWTKHTNGDVVAVGLFGPNSYCGGHFAGAGSFDGLERYKIGAVTTATGVDLSFAPLVNSALGIFGMGHNATALFIGGDFTKVGTQSQAYFGQFRDTTALTAPTTPGQPTGTPGDHQALVSWPTSSIDGGSPLLAYRVQRSALGGAFTDIGSTHQRSFVDTTAKNNSTYVYQVIASNAVGDSAPTATVSVTPLAGLLSVPSVPKSVTAASSFGTANLAWVAPASNGGSAVTAYRVYRSTASGLEEALVDLPPTTLAYTDSDVTIGTRYYYQVAALNAIGVGPLSAEKSVVPDAGVPTKPVLTLTTSTPRPALSWTVGNTGASPITKYVVTRNAVRLVTLQGAVPPTSYVDQSAVPGQTYTYQVKAFNAQGASPVSNSVVAHP